MNFKGFAVSIDGFYHDSPVILGAKTLERKDSNLPITGLTEIDRPPRQGMIRLGVKKKTTGGKEYPAEVDLYGRNTALKCIGDGETALCTDPQFVAGLKELTVEELAVLQEIEVSKVVKDPARPIIWCGGRACLYSVNNEKSNNKECKATATLSIEIPVLGGIGCWQITTGSFNSILNINGFIRDMVLRFGRAHMLPLTLERREIETIFKAKKAKHYPLYLNTHKSMGEMLKQLKIAPERVLIETYAEQSGELPPPAEIMDAEGTEIVDAEEKVFDPEQDEIDRLAEADEEKPPLQQALEEGVVASVDKDVAVKDAVDKVVETFDAKPADQQSAEFLKGLKEDGKVLNKPYDAKVEGEGYKKPPMEAAGTVAGVKEVDASKEVEDKINALPSNFFEFMNATKKLLKDAGKEDMYTDLLHRFSVKGLSSLKDDKPKQDKIMAEGILVLQEQL
jgi:hypothetical protein